MTSSEVTVFQTALQSCPFCGGDASSSPDEVGSGGQHVPPYCVGCKRCRVFFIEDEEQDAMAAWNRRVS